MFFKLYKWYQISQNIIYFLSQTWTRKDEVIFESFKNESENDGIKNLKREPEPSYKYNPANIYLFKVNNRSSRKRREICSKSSGWRRHWYLFGVSIVNFSVLLIFFTFFSCFYCGLWTGKSLLGDSLLEQSERGFWTRNHSSLGILLQPSCALIWLS